MSRHVAAYAGDTEAGDDRDSALRNSRRPALKQDNTAAVRVPALDWPADLFAGAHMLATAA